MICVCSTLGTSGVSSGHPSTLHLVLDKQSSAFLHKKVKTPHRREEFLLDVLCDDSWTSPTSLGRSFSGRLWRRVQLWMPGSPKVGIVTRASTPLVATKNLVAEFSLWRSTRDLLRVWSLGTKWCLAHRTLRTLDAGDNSEMKKGSGLSYRNYLSGTASH